MATRKAATTKKASSTRSKTASTKSTKSTRTVSAPAATAAATATTPSFSESVKQFSFWRSLGAELIGTFLLAAVFIVGQGQPLYTLFAVVGIILFVGTVSGSYINPALTVAAWITRRISWIRAVGYIVFEIIGALLALVVLNAFVSGAASSATTGAATTIFEAAKLTAGKEWFVFFSELLGTAIIGFALANGLRNAQERLTSAFTVGFGVFIALMISFIAASYVGATAILNPAVAFSLQALSWSVWPIAVYILAPIVGGAVGFFLNDLLKGRQR